MVIRTVNNKERDGNGNVNVGTITSVNGTTPDESGNIILPLISILGSDRIPKLWMGKTTTIADGNWSIDCSSANFTEIASIQVTLQTNVTNAADKPLGTHIATQTNTTITGKAYKVSSAGLLAAMQQISADVGVIVHVMIIGY